MNDYERKKIRFDHYSIKGLQKYCETCRFVHLGFSLIQLLASRRFYSGHVAVVMLNIVLEAAPEPQRRV